ncbi:MAG TPA: AmmeMemoRadiSam system protein A [Polyangium sp.]|nr:AmmeMemoRadiSam system protein A [Polyangium sp.]
MKQEIDGQRLLRLARQSIQHHLGGPLPDLLEEEVYQAKAATFVTVMRQGELHGCIGTLEPQRSLFDDVQHNAVAAAFFDPRSRPLLRAELNEVQVEVSLLGPLEPLRVRSEAEALEKIRPHEDGVVLRDGRHRATFLPQVWEKLPDPGEFLTQLKQKAGMPARGWSPTMEVYRYSLTKWRDDLPVAT